jgi:hypothetical protein
LDTTISPSQFTIPAGILQGTTPYFWKVRGFNIGGYGPFSVTWHFTTGIIGISQISGEIPKEFKLHNNFPNPFNPVTKIRFDIPSSHEIQTVKLVLFDLLGREIEVLVDSRLKPGYYEVSWDASKYPSGIYLCRITAGRYFSVIKMVVLK